jgi:hypothetical protein
MAGRFTPFHFSFDKLSQTDWEKEGIARGAILEWGGFNQIEWPVASLPFIFRLTTLVKRV